MITRRRFTHIGLAAFTLPSLAIAAPFTSQTIKVIVPNSPGPGTDVLARFFAAYMSKQWNSTVVVENKVGSGGQLATDFAAKAAPDGTVILITTSAHFTYPYLHAKLPFDAAQDFAPVAQFVQGAFAVVVATDSPFKTIQDLINEAKRQPGTISYASAGVGSPTHMAGAQFGHMAGINIVHIPYKDASQVMTDVIGGQLQMGLTGTSTAMSMIQAGKLRALAVTAPKRVPALANVPTLDESGLRGYDVTSPIFALTRAGTPPATVSEISRIMLEAANTPEFKQVADKLGYVMDLQDSAKMRINFPGEFARWKRMVEISGAKPG
ncbi:Bug family tripartite tricarboxylate transporter substrate binding protein [Variovorax sp. Root434]|uniref:Bug family tripartite tricarboxylate transporter substrate binding protein n=1 Tax=Variovorax sp. Root434 TaxID=1736536 RepID=UPI0009E7DCC8|nr:tripartite tricarboxylate transporter substrate binding protein [Variovorax sp. Root434]